MERIKYHVNKFTPEEWEKLNKNESVRYYLFGASKEGDMFVKETSDKYPGPKVQEAIDKAVGLIHQEDSPS